MNFDLNKLIGTNFDAKYKKTKTLMKCAIAGLPLGFIMFGGGMPLAMITGKYYLLFIPIIGILLFPSSIITLAMSSMKLTNMKQIKSIIDIVTSQDKVFIFQLSGYNPALELQYATVIQKLIDTGKLEGYTVIGNVAVAKTSLGLTEQDVKAEYMMLRFGKTLNEADDSGFAAPGGLTDYAAKVYGNPDANTKECYFCHTRVPKDATYCTKCGARLDN